MEEGSQPAVVAIGARDGSVTPLLEIMGAAEWAGGEVVEVA